MNFKRNVILTGIICLGLLKFCIAQEVKSENSKSLASTKDSVFAKVAEVKAPTKHWYEQIAIRGYTQVRYNRLLETNDSLKFKVTYKIGYLLLLFIYSSDILHLYDLLVNS
jgi:nucleoside-specific outer membrane channel protein Tsx